MLILIKKSDEDNDLKHIWYDPIESSITTIQFNSSDFKISNKPDQILNF